MAFEDMIGTMAATRKVNRLTVEARFGFPVSRESKYPAYQPLQRFASLLVNRLSWQTLSPFGCLLLRTIRLPRLDRQYCVADALLSGPLSAELVNGHHMRVSIWKNLKLYGGLFLVPPARSIDSLAPRLPKPCEVDKLADGAIRLPRVCINK